MVNAANKNNISEPSPELHKKLAAFVARLSDDEQALALRRLCHFTAKAVNSNTEGGIRLPADTLIKLPYVSVSTLGAKKVPLDYIKMIEPDSLAAKALYHGYISPKHNAHHQGGMVDLDDLRGKNVRLRQTIIKDDNEGYLSITPLHSAGLSLLIGLKMRATLDTEFELKDEARLNSEKHQIRSIPLALMSFGGTKKNNVGAHAYWLSNPLFLAAPTESYEVRSAYRFYFKGPQVKVSHDALRQYLELINKHKALHLKKAGQDSFSHSLAFCADENKIIAAIVSALLNHASTARSSVKQYLSLNDDQAGTLNRDLSVRGLMDISTGSKNLRVDMEWIEQMALDLTNRLINTPFKADPGDPRAELSTLGIGEHNSVRLQNIFKKEIRCQASI
ncbi:MAG: hypothetical protein CTY38_01175 [Methylotenera sp.]|uniref:hypothetical protein n=1 Tax=Methylotenera sp. TaxID=2051956 RepID=UPI000D436780|nr:hypothetical protein [Methylotenera sp.]PPC84688.1 MAG: hypothetical protein CTY38_01175 [Methylotenera sp.]